MSDKVAIVTGAGSGIGRATAMAFANRGYAVTVVGRRLDPLNATRDAIESAGGSCLVQSADLTDAANVDAVMRATVDKFGGVDVLVNNAAQLIMGPIGELAIDGIDAMLRANVNAVVYACRAVWGHMKQRGGGTIVNISSIASKDPFPGLAVYGATKAFVNLLTQGLATEGKPDNIRVFAVGPGAVETDMLRDGFPDFPADQALAPQDVAELITQLPENAMRHTTGQTLYIQR